MTKKLEYAKPVYYCEIRKELEHEGFPQTNTECYSSPSPNCRDCRFRKENEWNFDKENR